MKTISSAKMCIQAMPTVNAQKSIIGEVFGSAPRVGVLACASLAQNAHIANIAYAENCNSPCCPRTLALLFIFFSSKLLAVPSKPNKTMSNMPVAYKRNNGATNAITAACNGRTRPRLVDGIVNDTITTIHPVNHVVGSSDHFFAPDCMDNHLRKEETREEKYCPEEKPSECLRLLIAAPTPLLPESLILPRCDPCANLLLKLCRFLFVVVATPPPPLGEPIGECTYSSSESSSSVISYILCKSTWSSSSSPPP